MTNRLSERLSAISSDLEKMAVDCREASIKLDRQEAELKAFYTGTNAVIPKTKEHAEYLLEIAESAIATFRREGKI